jgi:Acetyl-CoA hydrolase
VESDEELFEVGLPQIGPVQEAIGKHVADLIDDGSTLQIGYGGIPDAVVMQLQHKRDLGIHTEMIGDGILSLLESGAVTNRKKTFMPGKTVATFALGSRRLYRSCTAIRKSRCIRWNSPTTRTSPRATTICARSTPPCRST